MDCKEKLPSALMKGYSRKFEKGLESMSPFEIKNKLIEFACLLYTSDAADDQ